MSYPNDYPYRATLREFTNGDGPEKFLTTQHERDVETGLDYRGTRFYDLDVARFLSLDPLAADYPSLSDYCYVAGNPIVFIDPTGMAVEGINDGEGQDIKTSVSINQVGKGNIELYNKNFGLSRILFKRISKRELDSRNEKGKLNDEALSREKERIDNGDSEQKAASISYEVIRGEDNSSIVRAKLKIERVVYISVTNKPISNRRRARKRQRR